MLIILLIIGICATSAFTSVMEKAFKKSFDKSSNHRIDEIKRKDLLSMTNDELDWYSIELIFIDKDGNISKRKGSPVMQDYSYYFEQDKLYLDNEDLRAFKYKMTKDGETIFIVINVFEFAQEKILQKYAIITFVGIVFVILQVLLVFYLFMRSIYKPIIKNFKSIEKDISKYTNKFSPIDENNLTILEAKNIAKKYNLVIDSFEEEQRQKQKALASGEMLITNLAHDLKSPITVLKGYTEVLMDQDLSEEQQKKYLGYIYKASNDLSVLIAQLFEQIKFKNGEYNFQKEETDICKILRDCCVNYYTVFAKMGFSLEADIPEESIYCHADKVAISRVFNNLLQNIIDHNEEPCKTEVTLEKQQDKLVINIKDNGIDISQNNREQLFNAFYQSDSSRSHGNSGLGLFIVKQIVEQHGGKICVTGDNEYNVIFRIEMNLEQ